MVEVVEEKVTAPETETRYQRVAILDAGAQYGKVIDRKVRSLRVKTEILPLNTPAGDLAQFEAIIISGGPDSVYSPGAPDCDDDILKLGKPILGICYGMQLLNHKLGGRVGQGSIREDGQCKITVDPKSPFFDGLEKHQQVLMSHGDSVLELAPGFEAVAYSNGLIAAIQNSQQRIYGVQFHPEVHDTDQGTLMLRNFLYGISELAGDYPLEDRAEIARRYIRQSVGKRDVLMFSSGGVDSTVTTMLLFDELGRDRVHVVHIGSDLMRQGESQLVLDNFASLAVPVTFIDATDIFAQATTEIDGRQTAPLDEVTDPEIKRRIIGDTFMKVKDMAMRQLGLDPKKTVLGQGTLRPDLIESASKIASGKAQVIKTHHNDTELVRKLRDEGKVVEPLRDFHKDEVRELGLSLGIPEDFVFRHPFPGPGLAIRVLCTDQSGEQPVDTNLLSSLAEFVPDHVSATVLPVRSVGVQGDGKSYSYAVGLSGEVGWAERFKIAREIPKNIRLVNRVVHIFGNRVDSASGVTQTYLNKSTLSQLRHADNLVNQILQKYNLNRQISQCPVVLVPLSFGVRGARAIVLRPFLSPDFMTGLPAMPGRDLPEEAVMEMVETIMAEVPGISRVMYDMTSKPPGTTEWE